MAITWKKVAFIEDLYGLAALGDPGADKIAFWDDSETALKWLSLADELSITTTTLSVDHDLCTNYDANKHIDWTNASDNLKTSGVVTTDAMRLYDLSDTYVLRLAWNETDSINRLLNVVVGEANRTITFSGNPTLANWFDQSVKAAATPAFSTINLTGGQITFPASQNASAGANTLDDYEEGTWTPDLQFGGAKVGITYDTQAGYYTKIGNLVTVIAHVLLTSKGTSVGVARLYGLPFTIGNLWHSGTMAANKITFTGKTQIFSVTGTTFIYLNYVPETGTWVDLANTHFANDSRLLVTMSYQVA